MINLQCGIFCHLEKTFDCVDHNILLSKLQYYGITGSVCTLIQSYLTGRYQCVVRNSEISNHNVYSKWGINLKGVPQGSILGPLPSVIYINNLPVTLNNKPIPILIANDTSVSVTQSLSSLSSPSSSHRMSSSDPSKA